MKFSEIISISGQPGLFKYLAQASNGIIVESLVDQKRFPVPSNAKVSALIDIAIYTESEDLALADVFQIMHDALSGAAATNHKQPAKELAAKFVEFIPTFDQDRVHSSDIKKVFQWYNLLQAAGMTDYNSELKELEEAEDEVEESAE